jgi:hypothetical protein
MSTSCLAAKLFQIFLRAFMGCDMEDLVVSVPLQPKAFWARGKTEVPSRDDGSSRPSSKSVIQPLPVHGFCKTVWPWRPTESRIGAGLHPTGLPIAERRSWQI